MSLSIFLRFNHQSSFFVNSAELKGTVFQSEDEVDEKVATRLKTDLRIPDLCKVNASTCCRKKVMAWTFCKNYSTTNFTITVMLDV